MRPLVFRHTTRGALNRYVHAPGQDVVVEESNWAVLSGDWPGDAPTPYMRHAVNNNNTEEVAVYLGLMWQLTQGLTRHAIPCYYRDGAARILGKDCLFVAWEYEVDAEDVDPDSRDRGFVPARSVVSIRPEPTAFEWEHRAEAGLFRVDTYDDLVGVTRATLGDASAEISLFALAGGLRDDLVDALRARNAPDLEDLLAEGDLFVDLTIGVDIGNYDSLIVYSRGDISERLGQLTQEYEAAIDAYESRVPAVSTVEGMLRELDRLARAQ
jgi:hypothetical protein